jgi:mannose-6-phosphate isomerase-like protein (cupin superfamily)
MGAIAVVEARSRLAIAPIPSHSYNSAHICSQPEAVMKHTRLTDLTAQGVSHNAAIRKKVMLQPGDLPHLTQFAQAQFPPGTVAGAHQHPDLHEVFLVESGTGEIIIDGQPYPLTPGVCVAVAPGEIHEVSNTGAELLTLTYFGIRVESP